MSDPQQFWQDLTAAVLEADAGGPVIPSDSCPQYAHPGQKVEGAELALVQTWFDLPSGGPTPGFLEAVTGQIVAWVRSLAPGGVARALPPPVNPQVLCTYVYIGSVPVRVSVDFWQPTLADRLFVDVLYGAPA